MFETTTQKQYPYKNHFPAIDPSASGSPHLVNIKVSGAAPDLGPAKQPEIFSVANYWLLNYGILKMWFME